MGKASRVKAARRARVPTRPEEHLAAGGPMLVRRMQRARMFAQTLGGGRQPATVTPVAALLALASELVPRLPETPPAIEELRADFAAAGWSERDTELESSGLAMLASWELYKQVFDADADLMALLQDTPLPPGVPMERLAELPYPAFYLTWTAPDGEDRTWSGARLRGLYVVQMRDVEGHPGLGLFADVDPAPELDARFSVPAFEPVYLPLTGTFGEGRLEHARVTEVAAGTAAADYERSGWDPEAAAEQMRSYGRHSDRLLGQVVPLLLYLASDKPDLTAPVAAVAGGRRGLHPPRGPVQRWRVGARIGAALRRADRSAPASDAEVQHRDGARARPRPHLRRAHWQTFWAGPQGSPQRHLVVHFVLPTSVNVDDDHPPVITIRPTRPPRPGPPRRGK